MKMMDYSSSSCFGDDNFFPPGFRFHPTDEELVLYYLKRKICRRRLKLDIIGETDVYKWDPEELPGQSKLKTGDRQWFFFSSRDRKYPNAARSNRATRQGYWKATGKDRNITCNSRSVGVKKTLVFYIGRAPAGKRTDWVMHEYTLDEEELKRCQTAEDYYALYKVYKKSGPGPKNGEQYGAPFREEDWADDCLFEKENSVKEVVDVALADNTRANSQPQLPLNDLEELMNRVVDGPMLVEPFAASALDQLADDGETFSSFIDNSLRDMNVLDQSIVLDPSSHQYNVQGGYDLTQSATTQLCVYDVDAHEVTSGPNIPQQQSQVAEEDFFKDFLEMDDLIGPEATAENFSNAAENFSNTAENFSDAAENLSNTAEKFSNLVDNLQFDETDVFSELDFFQDAASLGCDMVQCGPKLSSQPYMSTLENVMDNQFSQPYASNIMDEAVNYQQLQTDDVNQINSQPWIHDPSFNVISPARAIEFNVSPPPSGVVINGNSANLSTGVRQNHSGYQEDGTSSWFSSALWSLVESIPTTPASASENVLVNRAFERMSSFSRVRINSRNTNFAAGNSTVTSRSCGKSKMGFFCFSVLGLVFAILWLSIGTSVSVLGRNISS